MAPKTVEGGQIWLKCITGDLIMMIRDKNNIFEGVENFHADLAWNYPALDVKKTYTLMTTSKGVQDTLKPGDLIHGVAHKIAPRTIIAHIQLAQPSL